MSRSPDSPGFHPLFTRSELFHFEAEKKDNVAFSVGSSVTADLVGSVAECLIRVATDVKSQALP